MGLGGLSLANGVKIYVWGNMGRITGFVHDPKMRHVLEAV